MLTRAFWKETFERAAKSAAQAAALAGAALASGVIDLSTWQALGAAGAGAFALSVLTSIGSAPVGPSGTPSLTE